PSTQFVEVEGSHFVLLTDLPRAAALESVRRMENVLAALFHGSWQGDALPREKLRVLELASARDLHQFASPTMSAFYQPVDLFGEPMLVMSTEQGGSENVVLKHELAHALHGTFLPRSPRWFFEGLACYLETMQFDPARDLYLIGAPSEDRLQYLRYHPETNYGRVLTLPRRCMPSCSSSHRDCRAPRRTWRSRGARSKRHCGSTHPIRWRSRWRWRFRKAPARRRPWNGSAQQPPAGRGTTACRCCSHSRWE